MVLFLAHSSVTFFCSHLTGSDFQRVQSIQPSRPVLVSARASLVVDHCSLCSNRGVSVFHISVCICAISEGDTAFSMGQTGSNRFVWSPTSAPVCDGAGP